MLQPSKQQFEDDLRKLAVQTPDGLPADFTSNPGSKSILGTLVLLGTVFFLVVVGFGLFNYSKAKQPTASVQGEVIELRGGGKEDTIPSFLIPQRMV